MKSVQVCRIFHTHTADRRTSNMAQSCPHGDCTRVAQGLVAGLETGLGRPKAWRRASSLAEGLQEGLADGT